MCMYCKVGDTPEQGKYNTRPQISIIIDSVIVRDAVPIALSPLNVLD